MKMPAIRLSFAAARMERVTVRSCRVSGFPPNTLRSTEAGASEMLDDKLNTRYEPRSKVPPDLSLLPSAAIAAKNAKNRRQQPPVKTISATSAPSIDVKKFFMRSADATWFPPFLQSKGGAGQLYGIAAIMFCRGCD